MRDLVDQKNFTAAIEVLEKSDLKKNKSDQVLYKMELGSLNFYQGNFAQAARHWQNALELIAVQYTKISQVATSAVLSDKLKDYTPKDYEISYLYYHQALAFYYEYLKTNDRNILLQARASIVAWDVFLQNIKIDKKFKNLYFDDFYARFFAGLIHESLGERSDLEIAFQLYKDAYQLFLLQAPSYRRFSQSREESISYAEELMKAVQSKEKWRETLKALSLKNAQITNENFQRTKKFLASKLLLLAQSVRKNELKKLEKELNQKVNELNFNAIVMLHQGWMNPLEAKNIRLSLTAASKDGSASQAVLTAITQASFLVFAAKILGPTNSSSAHHQPAVNYSLYGTGDFTELSAGAASLEFQIPSVKEPIVEDRKQIKIQMNNESEISTDLIVLQSFNDVIFQTVERQKAMDVFFKGTRFTAKHIGAMLGAYAIYNGMTAGKSNNEAFARLAALASYLSAAKLINISENADLRYWSLLPATASFVPILLPKKTTKLMITKPDGVTLDAKLYKSDSNPKQLQIIPLL